jgi:hypothetical protein
VHGKVIRIAHGFACGRAHGPSAGSGSAQSLANGHDRFFPLGALVVPAVVVVHIYISFANLAGVPGRTMWHVCHLQAGILAARRSTVKNATVFRVLLQYVLTLS